MVRRAFASAVAAAAVALAASPSACKQPLDCTMRVCDPTHARIAAHVNAPLAELVAARTTVCWREVCAELVAAGDAGEAGEAGERRVFGFDERLGALDGDASIVAEGNGASLLRIDLRYFTRARDGDFTYTRSANGDRYRVTVVAPDGKPLFEAERTVTYEEYYPNGSDCDPDPCRRVDIQM